LNGVSFLAVIGALFLMRIAKTEPRPSEGSPLQKLIQGFHFAMNDRPIRTALLLVSLMSLFGWQYTVFMPIFARDVLHGGPSMLGLLMTSAGVGAVIGALHFASRTGEKGLVEWIAATSATCSLGLVLFSQSRVFWLSSATLLAVGFAATSELAATNTLAQIRVPDELRGRIMAVYATMFMGVQPLGALLAGGVAKRIGAPRTLAAFGTLCLLGSLLYTFRVALGTASTPKSAESQAGLGR